MLHHIIRGMGYTAVYPAIRGYTPIFYTFPLARETSHGGIIF